MAPLRSRSLAPKTYKTKATSPPESPPKSKYRKSNLLLPPANIVTLGRRRQPQGPQPKLQFRLPSPPLTPEPPAPETGPQRVPDARLRRTVLTREMDSATLSPLQRLENALKRKTAELGIAEETAQGRSVGSEEVADEGAEAVLKEVIGRRVER